MMKLKSSPVKVCSKSKKAKVMKMTTMMMKVMKNEADDWEKPEEEEEWDPDFDEFDVPKSKGKKSGGEKRK